METLYTTILIKVNISSYASFFLVYTISMSLTFIVYFLFALYFVFLQQMFINAFASSKSVCVPSQIVNTLMFLLFMNLEKLCFFEIEW